MDRNNWRAAQGQVQIPGQVIGAESAAAAGLEEDDWRAPLQADSRQRIVNKIMEVMKRHLPFSGQEGLQELKKIAVRLEEKIYIAATSQSDYLRKISLKMLMMEKKSQNAMVNYLQSNASSSSENPQDPGGDWRTQLQADFRLRIVYKIIETLKWHLPFSGQEGLQELEKIAVRFEEKIYAAATSQSDYLKKISLKLLTMENKSQDPTANSLQSNVASNSKNPQDPASQSM